MRPVSPLYKLNTLGRRGGASGPIVTLGKPTWPYLTVISETEIYIDWVSQSTNHDGHSIERTSVAGGGSGWTEIFTVTGTTVIKRDDTCIALTTYYYRIRAYKGTNYSDYSDVVSATTGYPWYLASGNINAVNAKGIYQPMGAVNLATSYINLVNHGINDAAPGVAPTHDPVKGWIFDGTTQYLVTGIVPVNNQTWSMFVMFADHTTGDDTLAGLYESATKQFFVQTKSSTNTFVFANGASKSYSQVPLASGDLLLAGTTGYTNGVSKVTAIPAGSGTITYDIWIGQVHYSSNSGFFDGSISFLAIYDTTLDATMKTALRLAVAEEYYRATVSNYGLRHKYLQGQFGALICWTIDSFTDTVPNPPDSDVNDFNPSDLDIDQWLDTCVNAGMKYAVLTVKAEDGFCLWPTAFTVAGHQPYSIGSTSWYAANQIDIVSEFTTKCREKGLRVGLYFGVMDYTWEARTGHDETTDAAGYITMIQAQLYELLTNYGPLDSFWIDSWKMRIGYEEIPFVTLYDYIKNLQPDCIVSDNTHAHPELGGDIEIYEAPAPDGSVPASNSRFCEEVVSIRTDGLWYYDSTVDQTATALRDTASLAAYKAQLIARHGTLLLGITPDTTGHLPAAQVTILEAM